ncbi:MAG: cell wall hydrolase, partial [Eubacteriales bacterium]|nr:cell wall hydrolase [Eubacteriales bacterium]
QPADTDVEVVDDDDNFDDGLNDDVYIDPETENTGDNTADNTSDNSNTVTASSDELDLLAALIYCEAGNQSYEGQVAVGQVVMNRVESSSFADSIEGVIYESGQFTPASSGALASAIGNAPSSCYDAAAEALSGGGSVPDALYFNTGSGSGVKIGAHQFY